MSLLRNLNWKIRKYA